MKKKKQPRLNLYDSLEIKWLNSFAALKAFQKVHKSAHVAVKYKKAYPILYRWTCRQRELMAEGKIDPIRAEKLNQINFIWNIRDFIWNQYYNQARAYYKLHGNINMTEVFKKKNRKLSKWMIHQREYFLHHKHLTNENIIKLNLIGFNKINYRDSWQMKYNLLIQFYKKNGHFDTSSNVLLNRWVIMQRHKKKYQILPENNIKLLNKIKFPWIRKSMATSKAKPSKFR